MSNAFQVWNNWFSVSSRAAMLALATQNVIALHLMRIAARGDLAVRGDSHGDGKGAGAWRSASGCCGWVDDRSEPPSHREESRRRL